MEHIRRKPVPTQTQIPSIVNDLLDLVKYLLWEASQKAEQISTPIRAFCLITDLLEIKLRLLKINST